MSDFNIDRIDEVIHGRLRLGIMACLSAAPTVDFSELRERLQTTDGNLSIHLRKLEDAGYVRIEKLFANRRPLTRIALSKAGRAAFVRYLDTMAQLIQQNAG